MRAFDALLLMRLSIVLRRCAHHEHDGHFIWQTLLRGRDIPTVVSTDAAITIRQLRLVYRVETL
jgi:hypothetical protein